MSPRISRAIIDRVRQAALASAWVQWRALGVRLTASGRAHWIVDPEALVLISLALREHERRLEDVLASWARTGSGVLSVQRVKNLQSRYPRPTGERLAEFAQMAVSQGGDYRWRGMAGLTPGPRGRDRTLRDPRSKAWDPAALMVRMRLGIGVGLSADILTFLLSRRGAWASARAIAEATDYSVYSIRRAADKMMEAGLVEGTGRKPVEYRVDPKPWSQVLAQDGDVPPWRHWSQAYAFVADFLAQAEAGALQAPSAYLLSSRLRDLIEKHQDGLRLTQIAPPVASRRPGEEYIAAVEQVAENIARWMTS